MKTTALTLLALVMVAGATLTSGAAGDGAWLRAVPERQRTRTNPYAMNPEAIQAGAKLFEQNCAQCHGENAEGKRNKPSLRSQRVQQAAPGELEWLLKNGSLKNGMPSWSRLPQPQRWQLVTYLKSLMQ